MDIEEILSKCDHTLLKTSATWEDIKQVIDDGINFKTASICIPPSFVKRVKDYACDKIKICTVIGFPNGYNTTKSKVFETLDAIENGADEIDMVINLGELKAKNYNYVLNEILEIKNACGNHILKVIIETCELTEEEKIKMCELVTKANADYIKTSTGFSKGGATREDVKLLKQNVGKNILVKASGGISSIEDATDFINLGASRLGTSRIVKIVKEAKSK